MTFTESNTVGQMIPDAVAPCGCTPASRVREDVPSYEGKLLGDELRPACEAIRAKIAGS
jgi:hypothetical protein